MMRMTSRAPFAPIFVTITLIIVIGICMTKLTVMILNSILIRKIITIVLMSAHLIVILLSVFLWPFV